MLRDPSLVPLSRQHQHALALCVRLNRASLSTLAERKAWQAEIWEHFEQEIQHHFAAEEGGLFPAARLHAELVPLVDELVAEHARLRAYFTQAAARSLDQPGLREFAELLSSHIRKEERQLFEGMQSSMSAAELQEIGTRVDAAFAGLPQICITPAESSLQSLARDEKDL